MKEETVLEWYQKRLEFLDAPCGGHGACGRCKIKFLKQAPDPNEKEREKLSADELAQGIRLACQTKWSAGMLWNIEKKEQAAGNTEIAESVKSDKEIGKEHLFGIALDIGTTTLAMRLVDLQTKESVATLTEINHQRAYGADVITRIRAANEGKGKELQSCILQDIAAMLVNIQKSRNLELSNVKKMVIAGNTTMCHLLLGYSCEGLGRAPFLPVNIGLIKLTAAKLFEPFKEKIDMVVPEQIEVTILPGISAFIGADITAGIYACDMDLKEETAMLLDIGTNGEMVIGNKHGFLVTSVAAGPVFEGGNISCGMPAVAGAITHFKDGTYEILGDEEVKGICGSGLIDLTAYLLKSHIIDENGTLCETYFDTGYPVLAEKTMSSLCLTQKDLREIQMGKAAIRTGIEHLTYACRPGHVYLAGGFGAKIDATAAVETGLFPKEFQTHIIPIGNGALEGAQKFLLDAHGTERVLELVQHAQEIFLAEQEDFEENYIHFMQFLV